MLARLKGAKSTESCVLCSSLVDRGLNLTPLQGLAGCLRADSVPLSVFTGQVNRAGIGKDAFQEADMWNTAHHQVRTNGT